MTAAAAAARDFFRADLAEAWARVDLVEGPALGDASAPLEARNVAFRARLRAFLWVFQCAGCGKWRQACRCPPPEFAQLAGVLEDPFPPDDPEPFWPPQ